MHITLPLDLAAIEDHLAAALDMADAADLHLVAIHIDQARAALRAMGEFEG